MLPVFTFIFQILSEFLNSPFHNASISFPRNKYIEKPAEFYGYIGDKKQLVVLLLDN